jgi:hypothetical protein
MKKIIIIISILSFLLGILLGLMVFRKSGDILDLQKIEKVDNVYGVKTNIIFIRDALYAVRITDIDSLNILKNSVIIDLHPETPWSFGDIVYFIPSLNQTFRVSFKKVNIIFKELK